MDRTAHAPRRPRQAVLLVQHADQHVEVYSEPNLDVYIVRVPVAPSRDAEALAEEVAELITPPRFRDLWRSDCLRAVGTSRPLLPSVARAALVSRDQLDSLNAVANANDEVLTWTL